MGLFYSRRCILYWELHRLFLFYGQPVKLTKKWRYMMHISSMLGRLNITNIHYAAQVYELGIFFEFRVALYWKSNMPILRQDMTPVWPISGRTWPRSDLYQTERSGSYYPMFPAVNIASPRVSLVTWFPLGLSWPIQPQMSTFLQNIAIMSIGTKTMIQPFKAINIIYVSDYTGHIMYVSVS